MLFHSKYSPTKVSNENRTQIRAYINLFFSLNELGSFNFIIFPNFIKDTWLIWWRQVKSGQLWCRKQLTLGKHLGGNLRKPKDAGAIYMWQEAVCGEEIIFGVVKLYDWSGGRKKLIGGIYSAYKFFNRWIFAKSLLCPVGNGFITEPKWLSASNPILWVFLHFSQNELTFNLS